MKTGKSNVISAKPELRFYEGLCKRTSFSQSKRMSYEVANSTATCADFERRRRLPAAFKSRNKTFWSADHQPDVAAKNDLCRTDELKLFGAPVGRVAQTPTEPALVTGEHLTAIIGSVRHPPPWRIARAGCTELGCNR
ncbi:hypothetical protein EVAR_95969_1 [Eumeta japonica]|uniref:Uncharacterized protein n=1 Tax=Eumeta variegata TaxID=151549 RepID=A0A4C1VAC9_EUMVA|nr:hypothetical protein EVAR_95969_1 [Eumeta japonica]